MSSDTLKEAVEREKRPAMRDSLMVGLSQKAEKKDTDYLEKIYRSKGRRVERRYALMGLARANPERAVEIIQKEIFGKEKSSILWKLYALDALYRARVDSAQKLLDKLSHHPSSQVARRAKRYAAALKKRPKHYSIRSRDRYYKRKYRKKKVPRRRRAKKNK